MRLTSEQTARSFTVQRAASLHAVGGGWSLVVASGEGGALKVVAAERLSAGDSEGVKRAMSTHRADHLVRVIPTGEAIVRSVVLPGGDAESMGAALDLMAEAQLPSSVEPHRRGAGLLPLRHGVEGQRIGLLAGWVSRDTPDRVLDEDDAGETWVTAGAALGCLLALDSQRDAAVAPAWAGAGDAPGASAVLVHDEAGVRIRAGRIGNAGSALREMVDDPSIARSSDTVLDARTTDALRAVAPTSGIDSAWLAQHAVAAGAAVGAVSAGGGLFAMLAEPPKYHYTVPQRTALWLADGKKTRSLVLLGLLLVLVAPLALIYAQNATISRKLENARAQIVDDGRMEVRELEREAIFARALVDTRTPLSKLIAAISDAAPVGDPEGPLGVQLDELDIDDERVTIRGEATTRDIVISQFAPNLRATELFTNVTTDFSSTRASSDSEGVPFTLSASIAGSTARAVSLANGFADTPFAVRLHGEEAAEFDYASLDAVEESGGSASRGPSRSTGGSPGRRASFDGGAGDEEQGDPVPEVLSQETIDGMTLAEAQAAWVARRTVRTREDVDEETKRALSENAAALRERITELRSQ